jgi:peptide/nickel transport system substrate-binding protein
MRSPLLLLAALALAACNSPDRTAAAGEYGGTLIITPPADASSIFPPFVAEATDHWVQDQVFDRLAEINADLTTIGDKGFTPRLAQKWECAPDSMSIAFSIDPRARWHDGKPVTAADVRYTFRAYTDPKAGSPNASNLMNIDSVSVRDSLTAVVWFKRRKPEQFYDVAYQLLIVPEHVYGAIPMEQLRTSPLTRTPIGSGRFRFVRWDPGTRIELVADTANYRGRAKLDRVIFTPVDAVTASTQILVGQADFMEAFPIDRAAALDTSKVARAIMLPTFGYSFMAMNSYDPKSKNRPHPVLSDSRVRRALAMSVDRVAMLHNVFGDNGHLSYGPFPATVKFADTTLRVPPYDTAAAKALLDSAGWRVGPDGSPPPSTSRFCFRPPACFASAMPC